MPRMTRHYAPPIDIADGSMPTETGHGRYTLVAGHTYVYLIGGAETVHQSVHLTGYTSGLIITSATIQDADHAVSELTDVDVIAGGWITEDPPVPAFVAVDGTGWTQVNCVVAAAGTGVGGARWNLGNDAATRSRLAVVVGAAGGDARVSVAGKMP